MIEKPAVVNDMKKEGMWSPNFAEAVKEVDGDVMLLDIPKHLQEKLYILLELDTIGLLRITLLKWVVKSLHMIQQLK